MKNLRLEYLTVEGLFSIIAAVGIYGFLDMNFPNSHALPISYHAPYPELRIDPYQQLDATMIYQGKSIITITKEAKTILASKGQQLEITSINAPILLRAQKDRK